MHGMVRFINATGAKAIAQFQTIYEIVELGYDTVIGLFVKSGRRRLSVMQLVNQILFTGVDALVIVGIIAISCGVTITIQAITNMPKIGVGEYFGKIMVITVIRELGPFFTSIVVIGRSGAALAAYIGNMRVSKEIAALEAMGVNTVHFLVVPAFIGMSVSLICLSVFFDVIAIVGGLLVAKSIVAEVPFGIFITEILHAIILKDVVVSVFKCLLFGSIIAVVSCYHGLAVDNVRIVPRAVFRAVVGSIVVTIVTNVIITIGFYAL